MSRHSFEAAIRWTGNRGEGTRSYRAYDRTWCVETPGQSVLHGSNDPRLGGDPALPNPEQLLLAALSACHMLWYLHLAARAGITVTAYSDSPLGDGETMPDGSGRFRSVTLRPAIALAPGSDRALADRLHAEVGRYCFIALSVAFPVHHAATYEEAD
jgi:organic hydroperoxide reductase OsmC/OhrA